MCVCVCAVTPYQAEVWLLLSIDMMKQALQLAKKPHVVIATPGRLADHLRSTDTVSLDKIRFLV